MVVPLEMIYHQKIMDYLNDPIFKDIHLANYLKEFYDKGKNFAIAKNPMCGDVLCFERQENNHIFWYGEGCIICLASAEALSQIINDTILEKRNEVCGLIDGFFVKQNNNNQNLPEKFIPFQSVKEVKSRINCVMLGVRTIKTLLQGI